MEHLQRAGHHGLCLREHCAARCDAPCHVVHKPRAEMHFPAAMLCVGDGAEQCALVIVMSVTVLLSLAVCTLGQ